VKILFLNQTFYPDVASTAQHLSDLAVALTERGHDVTVVCSQRAYDTPKERYRRREVWLGVQIRRIASFGFGKNARWRRAADFGSFLANCMIHLAALPRYDMVVAMTSPPLISWLGAVFARIKGDRFVFWIMDLNPDQAVAAGWLRPNSWTTKVLRAMLHHGLRQAAAVVVLDRFMADRIAAKGVDPEKISTLPPWSHDHVVRHDIEGRDHFRKEHGLDGKYVVMYSGNHSPCHPLSTLLEAAKTLRDRPDIVFCFVGGGSEFQTVQRFAAQHELQNIVTAGYQPLNRLSASLSSADLHVVVMGDPFVGVVHPCKVYNIRTLGIPYLYIGPKYSHVSDLDPACAARHGDIASVVSHIVEGAESGRSRSVPAETAEHSQREVVAMMVSTLESVPARAAAIRPKAPALKIQEQFRFMIQRSARMEGRRAALRSATDYFPKPIKPSLTTSQEDA
jgi:colanic acid biosynthesis glycosyl transferase WcaI